MKTLVVLAGLCVLVWTGAKLHFMCFSVVGG